MLFEMVIMPFLDAEIMPLPIRAIMPKLCRRRELCRNCAALKWAQNFLKRHAWPKLGGPWPKLGRAKVPSSLGCRNWAGNAFGSIGIITVFVHFRHFDMVRCMYIVLVSIAILYYCSMLLNAR